MNIAEKELVFSQNNLTIAENMNAVYEAGKASAGVINWDFYQMNGNRENYSYAFAEIWDDNSFAPEHDIKAVGVATGMFYATKITDLKGIMERQGVKLDTSRATDLRTAFQRSSVTRLPEISAEGISTSDAINATFALSKSLERIDMFVLPTAFIINVTSAFAQCSSLTYLRVRNIKGSFSVPQCPLDVDSLKNVIQNLAVYSGTNSEGVYTVVFKKTAFDALEAEGITEEDYDWLETVFPNLGRDNIEWVFSTWEDVLTYLGWDYDLK